jgi:O-antigen ligase
MVTLARPARAAATAPAAPSPSRLSRHGKALFVCVLLLGASAFPNVRPKIAGLLVHPVTLATLVLVVVGAAGLRRLPRSVALALLTFVATFAVSSLAGPPGGVNFAVKVAASAVAVAVGATFVRTRADLRVVIIAFALAVATIAVRGLFTRGGSAVAGINPLLGVANKNGFSLFALPALMLASFTVIRADTPNLSRWILVVSSVFIVFAVFSTANRSGWIGVIVIALLLSVRAVRRVRTTLLLVTLAGLAAGAVMLYGNTLILEDRLAKTNVVTSRLRVRLALSALEVGVKHPLLGASPQGLPEEMARLSGVRALVLDSHNVTGLIIGGTGALGTGAFVLLVWVLARRPRGFRKYATPDQREAHFLLRAMMLLWIVRGQFTAEILYSPSFSLALGLCIGGCIITGVWHPPPRATALPRVSWARRAMT